MINVERCRFLDLTQTISPSSPTWDGRCGFHHEIVHDYNDGPGPVKFINAEYQIGAGVGTHIDSPSHCVKGGQTIDEMPLEKLIAPCVCIDVIAEVGAAGDAFLLSVSHLREYERTVRSIAPGDIVIVSTGWARRWEHPDAYRNHHVYPSVSAEAADYLLARGIVGLGIDTLSPDRPTSGYPVHEKLLGQGKYLIENVGSAQQLPATGAYLGVFPLKIKGGAESPIRLVAFIPND